MLRCVTIGCAERDGTKTSVRGEVLWQFAVANLPILHRQRDPRGGH